MRMVALAASLAALAGCARHGALAGRTVVTPATERMSANVTTYSLPDGEVRVAMLPMVQLPALWIGQQATRALHVRVTFDNIGERTWTVFPRKQLARIGEYGPSLPAAAPVDPLVVTPGKVRVLDLFYPVPVPKYGPEVPTSFTLDWAIEQPGARVAGRTPMDPRVAYLARHRF